MTVTATVPEQDAQGYVTETGGSAAKTDTPLLETPQAVSIISSEEVAARAAQSITQAVAYTPGVVSGMFGPSTPLPLS